MRLIFASSQIQIRIVAEFFLIRGQFLLFLMSLDRAVFWSCSRKCLRSAACLCVKLLFGSVFLRVMNVVKTYLFFQHEVLNY